MEEAGETHASKQSRRTTRSNLPLHIAFLHPIPLPLQCPAYCSYLPLHFLPDLALRLLALLGGQNLTRLLDHPARFGPRRLHDLHHGCCQEGLKAGAVVYVGGGKEGGGE